jgi:hypothetical protein
MQWEEKDCVRLVEMPDYSWSFAPGIGNFKHKCGYCERLVAAQLGMASSPGGRWAYVCPNCERISYLEVDHGKSIEQARVTPAPKPGDSVAKLPAGIEEIYEEARASVQAAAYTGAVQLCRTLIGHIAEEEGSTAHTFKAHLDYLHANHYTPPKSDVWIDHIRNMGNEATHELRVFDKDSAEEVLRFTQRLLEFIYDYGSFVPPSVSASPASSPTP